MVRQQLLRYECAYNLYVLIIHTEKRVSDVKAFPSAKISTREWVYDRLMTTHEDRPFLVA